MRSERARACDFKKKDRWLIYDRDRYKCIFCESGREDIPMPSNTFEEQINGIMHYIPRSQGGLGIPQNGALGCNFHHWYLDNHATDIMKDRMKEIFREYLKSHYQNWNEEDLVYDKWKRLEE